MRSGYVILISFVAGAFLATLLAWWLTNSHWSAKWQDRDNADLTAQIEADRRELKLQNDWQAKINQVAEDGKIEQAKIADDAANLAAINDRLRKSLKLSESKYQSVSATVTELRRTAATAEVVRSNMLGWCLNRVEQLAGIADRSRAAGLSCQKAYNSIRIN